MLADPARAAEYANVRTVLAEMGRVAAAAAGGRFVEQADPKLTVQAIRRLAEMKDPRRLVDLLGRVFRRRATRRFEPRLPPRCNNCRVAVPTAAEAIRLLIERRRTYFDRRQPIEA